MTRLEEFKKYMSEKYGVSKRTHFSLNEIKERIKYIENILPKVAGCGFEEVSNIYLEDVPYLISRVDKLEAALKFYADAIVAEDLDDDIEDMGPMPSYPKERMWHHGKAARAALSNSEEEMK